MHQPAFLFSRPDGTSPACRPASAPASASRGPLSSFRAVRLLAASVFVLIASLLGPGRAAAEEPALSLARDTTPGAMGTYKLWLTGETGEVYFLQTSASPGGTWTFAQTAKVGNGGLIEYWFTPVTGQRLFFRVMYSTSPPADPNDADADGLTNNEEITLGTLPLTADTDGDGLDDGSEKKAGLNPKVPDDTRPAVFALKWQRTDSAVLEPQGWQSGSSFSTSLGSLPLPNYYRSLTVTATENGSGSASGAGTGTEFSKWKTMNIRRVLDPVPGSYAAIGAGTLKQPVYTEKVSYDTVTGKPFTSITVDSDPAGWASSGGSAPAAHAARAKWLAAGNKTFYDYDWEDAPSQSNITLSGPFLSVQMPKEITGNRRTWTNPPLSTGSNPTRYALNAAYPISLPNRNHPADGRIMAGGSWQSHTYCIVNETSVGNEYLHSTWTLADRCTFASLRGELKTMRPKMNSLTVAEGGSVSTPGYAFYTQDRTTGKAAHDIYEFKFTRTSFSPATTPVGAVTLTWAETFTPGDNPDTAADESLQPQQYRIRTLALPANTLESPILKLDHTVSPFTRLPGDPVNDAAATVSFGSTTVSNLLKLDIGIANGQGAASLVPDDREETVGAFTVANLNDTDGDGIVDSDTADTAVNPSTVAAGFKEVDLMRLEINGPSVGRVKVTASGGGSVSFWKKSTKEDPIPTTGGAFYLNGTDLPATVWVQAAAASTTVRDILIQLGYEDDNGHTDPNADRVKATAIWVDNTQVVTTTQPLTKDGVPVGWDLDRTATIKHFKDRYNSKFGVFDARPDHPWFSAAIGFEFLVKPPGIGKEPGVIFDITRRKENRLWGQDSKGWQLDLDWQVFPDAPDAPNDDRYTEDEDDVPANDHIYSIDNPSNSIVAPPVFRVVKRGNFSEYVRVKLNGVIFANVRGQVEGSRCSYFRNWQMRSDISSNGSGIWGLTPGVVTEVKGVTSFTPLGNHP